MFRRRSDFWEFTERIGLNDWYLSVVRGSRSHAVARAHFDPQRTRREGSPTEKLDQLLVPE